MSHVFLFFRVISFLGMYRAHGKPLISLNHDANMYIFEILFILCMCATCACATCVCTIRVQVPVKPEEGVKAPGTGMTGSSELPNMGAGN